MHWGGPATAKAAIARASYIANPTSHTLHQLNPTQQR